MPHLGDLGGPIRTGHRQGPPSGATDTTGGATRPDRCGPRPARVPGRPAHSLAMRSLLVRRGWGFTFHPVRMGSRSGCPCSAQHDPAAGRIPSGPNSSNANTRSGTAPRPVRSGRAHQHAAAARKRGALAQDELEDPPHPTLGQALGRSRGGLTTKVHLAADGRGLPLAIIVTPGNVNDSTVFDTVLDAVRVPPGPRRTRSGPLKAGSARRARASGGTSPVSWHPRR